MQYTAFTKVGSLTFPDVILINIDMFNHYHVDRPILEFQIRTEDNILENDSYLSIHFVVENAIEESYNKNEIFKKFATFMSLDSLKKLEDFAKGEKTYMAPYRKIKDLFEDDEFMLYYKKEELDELLQQGMLKTGLERGKKEGLEQGLTQGKKEIAKKMKEMKMVISNIAEITGLSIKEIESL